jgi:hypothetical protein
MSLRSPTPRTGATVSVRFCGFAGCGVRRYPPRPAPSWLLGSRPFWPRLPPQSAYSDVIFVDVAHISHWFLAYPRCHRGNNGEMEWIDHPISSLKLGRRRRLEFDITVGRSERTAPNDCQTRSATRTGTHSNSDWRARRHMRWSDKYRRRYRRSRCLAKCTKPFLTDR